MHRQRMTSLRLYQAVANRTGLTRDEAQRILENTWDVIQREIAAGGRVTIIGFGTFSTYIRAARRMFGRFIPSRRAVRFNIGSQFSRTVRSRG